MSARQWHDRGVPPPLMRSLIRSGQLIRMRQGAYATRRAVDWAGADPVRAHVLDVLAARATLSGSGNAVASYQSAARLHRLSLLAEPPNAAARAAAGPGPGPGPGPAAGAVTLTLPPDRKRNRAKPADVVFHASQLPKDHVARLYNLPLTTVARTVADLARTLPFMDAVVVADSALNQEKTTKPELHRVLEGGNGWPGVRQARRVVDFADGRAESPLESAARVVFAEAALNPPELQVTIHGQQEQEQFAARVDFLWREDKVIAEADGLVKYNDRRDLLKERERDHQLRAAGYTVVHFTWQELFQAKETVVERVRNAR